MSLYYGNVIPARVRREANKLVDRMKTKIAEQAETVDLAKAKARRI